MFWTIFTTCWMIIWISQLERRNSKGRSGYTFWLILQKTFAAFSHRKLKVAQIWSTHQSKALIFFFGMKKFGVGFLKILWETDKVHFTSSNLVCVYTHPKFQNMKFSLSVSEKMFKNPTQNFFYAKIENQSFRLMGWSYLYHF